MLYLYLFLLGRILLGGYFIISGYRHFEHLANNTAYAASKGGVISLTRTIAREFGPKGIRANVICPSMTETGMLDGNVTAEQFRDIVNAIPLRRAGRASDIAGACLFLASDLSAYVTGATIDVNGGSHIH